MRTEDRRIGITTTVPIEFIFAAGYVPVDLNNVFITSDSPIQLIQEAESAGFPRNVCAWIKGIYGAARRLGIKRIIGVSQGDCSNTHALLELLQTEGVAVWNFAFPYERERTSLERELDRLCEFLGVTRSDGEAAKAELDAARRPIHLIDELTWREGIATGLENHLWSISCSDMRGDFRKFRQEAEVFLGGLAGRPSRRGLRLGLIGIPPICSDLFDYLEGDGAQVVLDEMPRQFSMPYAAPTLLEQYLLYTYPYDVFFRISDITIECARRKVEGLVHYVQSFCFRQIQDRVIRERIPVPILTLEFDRPGPLDERSKTRIEAFLEMLKSTAVARG